MSPLLNMERKNKSIFKIGEIVFVKLKGYPHWPAKIIELDTTDKHNKTKYKVSFYGDGKLSYVKESDTYSYTEHKDLYGQQKTDNYRNKLFNEALREAENAFLNVDLSNTNTPLVLKEQSKENDQHICEKVQNFQERNQEDLETSLTLAAEAGTVLLAENSKLRQELHDLKLKIAHLEDYTTRNNYLASINLAEEKIEELESEKEALLSRNTALVETLNTVEYKLVKEKQLRTDLLLKFEEQDNEKEKILCNLEKKVKEQQEEINRLKRENPEPTYVPLKTKKQELTKTAAQTKELEMSVEKQQCGNCIIYIEEAKNMIQSIRILEDENRILTANTRTSKFNRGCTTTSSNKDLTWIQNESEHMSVSNKSQQTPQIHKTEITHTTLISKQGKRRSISKQSTNMKKNLFSVSLQVQKNKLAINNKKNENCIQRKEKYSNTKKIVAKLNVEMKPPYTARIRRDGQTYENFYLENIDFYKATIPLEMTRNLTPKNLATLEDNTSLRTTADKADTAQNSFLAEPFIGKVRYKTRLFLNQTRSQIKPHSQSSTKTLGG